MAGVSCTRGMKRKLAASIKAAEPKSRFSRVNLLSSSHLLLEVPADTTTSFPVWEAIRSDQVDVSWTMNPYSLSINITPLTSKLGKSTTSCKSESSSSSMAQTTVVSSSLLHPQLDIQPITQQHGASQNNSCVLLTFSQNTQTVPSPPNQEITPNPTTSFIVSLPIIITQSQPVCDPSTPTKKGTLPTTQTPGRTPTKQPTKSPSKQPIFFHTKSSSDIQICDNFLFSTCAAGEKCEMHHTPCPFHWQLWCVTTHKWVDISHRSQVLLERLYCDVSQDDICLRDGSAHYTLNFDSMELDGSSVYSRVRRLSNTNSKLRNPHFASKWKIYWWNNINWEEYSKSLSTTLLKKMSKKESDYFISINSQNYKVDFNSMTQTNMTTGFQRGIRCRPVYHSLEYMKPYLRTGILSDSAEPDGDPPGANFSVDPLEEFSSWYPPVWCQMSEQDYSRVAVPTGTLAYQRVQQLFYETLSETKVDIISIQQVQNLLHWDKYQRHKAYMQKQHGKCLEPLERHLFHGTTKQASEHICYRNFDPRLAGVNGSSFGFGTYFATTASLSSTYSSKSGPDEVRHMFLAKVLVGKMTPGKFNYRRPPPLISKKKPYCLFDTCVDNMNHPAMFIVFDSCQCYPYYLIKYKELPTEIDI